MLEVKNTMDNAEKAAKTAERYPWGTTIVVCIITVCIVYRIMVKQVDYANKRADESEREKSVLINKLLLKNNVIENFKDTIYVQRELIKEADSLNKEFTENAAIGFINKNKRP